MGVNTDRRRCQQAVTGAEARRGSRLTQPVDLHGGVARLIVGVLVGLPRRQHGSDAGVRLGEDLRPLVAGALFEAGSDDVAQLVARLRSLA